MTLVSSFSYITILMDRGYTAITVKDAEQYSLITCCKG
jgi:hypothetical protein